MHIIMKASYLTCFLGFILVRKCNGNEVFNDVCTAIEKSVAFYESNYMYMNIDGIFGLRILEGQFQIILSMLQKEHQIPANLEISRLTKVHSQVKNLSIESLKVMQETDKQYYSLMNAVIQRPWTFGRRYRRINPALKWKEKIVLDKEKSLNEQKSDKCMSELMGDKFHPSCSISKECLNIMSQPGMDGYVITHQLLYTMLAKQSDCHIILNEMLKKLENPTSLSHLQVEFCTNNFYETSQLVTLQKGTISPELQDLFLEQELVCSMLGFVEFLHIYWLKEILSWQMPSGCFGNLGEGHLENRELTNQPGFRNDFQQLKYIKTSKSNDSFSFDKFKAIGSDDHQNLQSSFQGNVTLFESGFRNGGRQRLKMNPGDMRSNVLRLRQGKIGQQHVKLDAHKDEEVVKTPSDDMEIGRVFVQPSEEENEKDKSKSRNKRRLLESFEINRVINRKLLYEKTLKDGCLSHKTAVGVGALSQYLRFLILANSSGIDAHQHLTGINYLLPNISAITATTLRQPQLKNDDIHRPTTTSSLLLKSPRDQFQDIKKGLTSGREIDAKNKEYVEEQEGDRADKEMDAYADSDDKMIRLHTRPKDSQSEEDELILYDEVPARRSILKDMKSAKAHSTSVDSINQKTRLERLSETGLDSFSSVGSTYTVVVIVTILLLIFLYRLLRKHRGGIHNRYHRLKQATT